MHEHPRSLVTADATSDGKGTDSSRCPFPRPKVDLMRSFTMLTWGAVWIAVSAVSLVFTGCHWAVLIHTARKAGMH